MIYSDFYCGNDESEMLGGRMFDWVPRARQAAAGAILACGLAFTHPCAPYFQTLEPCISIDDESPSIPVPGSLVPVEDFLDCDKVELDVPQNILEHLQDRVDEARVPQHWLDEGIPTPSDACYKAMFGLIKRIYIADGLLPSKLVPTRSSALYVAYRNSRTGFTLRIEVDDDLDATAVVSNGQGILEAGAFEDAFADRALAILRGTLAPKMATQPGASAKTGV